MAAIVSALRGHGGFCWVYSHLLAPLLVLCLALCPSYRLLRALAWQVVQHEPLPFLGLGLISVLASTLAVCSNFHHPPFIVRFQLHRLTWLVS